MDIKKEILRRFSFVYFAFFVLIAIILIDIFYLNTFRRSYLNSKQIAIKEYDIFPQRGDLYDDKGRLLATTFYTYTITMDPLTEYLEQDTFNKYIDPLCEGLAEVLKDKTAQEYKTIIVNARTKKNRDVLIAKDVNYIDFTKINQLPLFNKGRNKGGIKYIVEKDVKPVHGNLGRRIIGFDNTKDEFFGIEQKMNEELGGSIGREWGQNLGKDHHSSLKLIQEPENGLDVITTLDINMQDIVDRALRKQLEELDALSGVAILMEVNTGEIKAMANLHLLSDSSGYDEIQNMAVTSFYEPGSVMKLASMMIAFEKDGSLTPDKMVNTGDGIWQVNDFTITDYKKGGFGRISVRQVFELSSNIGTAKIIKSIFEKNPQDFINRMAELNFNNQLGLDIDNPVDKKIKTPNSSDWSGVSLLQMSYGYEILLTPMQIITFYNAIANNGRMVRPMFVKRTQRLGVPYKEYEPEDIKSSICSKRTLDYCQDLLKGVVEEGTGKEDVKSDLVSISGKSGTAQILENGSYSSGGNVNATFVGYFPADKPKYTCLVWISEPKQKKSGAGAAGPVLKEIAEAIYTFDYDLHYQQFVVNQMPDKKTMPYVSKGFIGFTKKIFDNINIKYSDNKTTWIEPKANGDEFVFQSMYVKKGVMPNVQGMNARDAVFLLENYKVDIKLKGVGKVIKQSISPGAEVNEGDNIVLTLG